MKYYCRDQFKTMHIRSTNSGQVLVSPCCAAQTEPVAAADFDFAANEFLQQTRQHTVNDTPAPACSNCWRQEAQNPPSRRFFSNQNKSADICVELNRIDVTTQNVCNLACIMCSSYSSSTWAREEGLTDQDYSFEHKLQLFRRLDFSHVYQMHFTGGEPLMSTEHLKMLGIYAESSSLSQLHISYNTNGTFFPDQRVLDIWSQVKAIDLVISLDATGAACELIRWPAKWEQIAANIAKFFELRSQMPHLKIGFISCASNYNLFELADVIDFVHSHDPALTVHFQVNHKSYFAPALIPNDMMQSVLVRLGAYPELENLLHTIQTRPSDDHCRKEMITYHRVMKEMESRRGTDWRSVLQIGKYMS
jgi:pyruvate-formate lyase-activating enzyme